MRLITFNAAKQIALAHRVWRKRHSERKIIAAHRAYSRLYHKFRRKFKQRARQVARVCAYERKCALFDILSLLIAGLSPIDLCYPGVNDAQRQHSRESA
jgi:hypothetical protein